MKKYLVAGGLVMAAQFPGVAGALASPWEDGMAAYNRGDYVPAIRLFRPLAESGNPKAQGILGVMYQRGQGVARSSVRAFMWLSLASARGDARAREQLRDVAQSLTPEELSQAREIMQICEASNFQTCEY